MRAKAAATTRSSGIVDNRQMRRGRFKRGCLRLAYQIPVTILAALGFVVIIMHSGDRRLLTPEEIATAGFGYKPHVLRGASHPGQVATPTKLGTAVGRDRRRDTDGAP